MIIIIGFILLLGLFLIVKGIKYRSEITSNKEIKECKEVEK